MAQTADSDSGSFEDIKRIDPAALLYGVQKMFGEKARAKTKEAYGPLIGVHLLVARVLAACLLRTNAIVTSATATSEQRNALFAAFVIGLTACESAIEEARYLQAHALLRQELEILAQLGAVRDGRRRPNSSPNVMALEESLRRLYGDLSAAAHVSRHDIIESVTLWNGPTDDLPGPTHMTRYFPEADEGLARRSFALHLYMMIRLIEELNLDLEERHPDHVVTEDERAALNRAVMLMVEERLFEWDIEKSEGRD
ncbi:hypothetical protein [Bradyrhizobium sp.]|uniref:hypothetical protein n=1 Tax=Bradyrhizobium sp. TaxID=376 RepID=UPI002D38CAD9|nr:hypothetical protein [Bradyrhizobium sp.]HZR73457.1 hypothetical protein [Bradyrhizobium sp.]